MALNPYLTGQQFLSNTLQSPNEKLDNILEAWNKGDLRVSKKGEGGKLSRNQAEALAAAAYGTGKEFKVRSKPLSKFAFNLADTASFGLLPDSIFKPTASVGEQYFGQSESDSIASGAGSLLGLVTGGYGLMK